MNREVPPLFEIVLKLIAKKPGIYMTESSLMRFNNISYFKKEFDMIQTLIDAITEAGRLTDEIFPLQLFRNDREILSIKNSKLTAKYI